jgi:ABC-type glycerol-3-phosphate transport system substrate-binding protein
LKRLLILVLAVLVFLFLFSGCSKNTKGIGQHKKDVIQFWVAENFEGEGKLWEKVVEKYNKDNSDVEVDLSVKPWDRTPLNVALQANKPPDVVFHYFSDELPIDAYEDLRVDLLDYLTQQEKEDFGPEIIQKFTNIKGKMYNWPWFIFQTAWMLGNGDVLQQAGIKSEQIQRDGWSWEEFLNICEKTSDNKRYGYGDAQSPNTINILLNGIIGPVLTTKEPLEFKWGSHAALSVLKSYRDLIYKDKVMPKEVLGVDIFGLHEMFQRKQFSLIRSYIAWIPSLEERGNISKVYILPYPKMDNKDVKINIGAGGWSVFRQEPSRGDDHLKKVIAFVKYISKPMDDQFIPSHWSGLPASRSDRETFLPKMAKADSNINFMAKALENGRMSPSLPTVAKKMSEIVNTYISEAMSGKITAKQAVEKWTGEAEKLVD